MWEGDKRMGGETRQKALVTRDAVKRTNLIKVLKTYQPKRERLGS